MRNAEKGGIRKCLAGAAALAAVCMLSACGADNRMAGHGQVPEFVLTYAENQPKDYPTTQGAYKFAELVKERTGGRIEILVYADGELGDEQAVVEQLQFGGIDCVRASLSHLSEIVPELNVLQMPYLYRDSEHMWQVLEGEIGDKFIRSLEGSGLTGLSWYDAGARNFYTTTRPITCLEDMQGMTIRVQESRLMEAVVEAMGADAVRLTYEKVYAALETGTIDGAENNWPSYESVGHYEVAKFYTVDEHTRVPEMQLISQRTWNKLKPEDRKILLECAQESAVYERRLWEERSRASEEKVRAAGCTVIELSPEEKERFREAVTPVYEKFCADDMDMIEAIVAVGKDTEAPR